MNFSFLPYVPPLLFAAGIFVVLYRKSFVGILVGMELMLNAAALNFVFIGNFVQKNLAGQLFGIFIMLVAVAEAVVSLAIILRFYKIKGTIHNDEASQLQG